MAAKKSTASKQASRKTAQAKKSTASAATKGAARRPAAGKHTAAPSRLRTFLYGERPLLVAMFGAFAVLVAMLLGPLQSFTAASERVDELQERRVQLAAAVDDLESRRARLTDPEHVELRAREELGMVKPGEIPYVVTGPRGDVEKLPRLLPTSQVSERSWWDRVTTALGKLFDRGAAQ